jgi:DNA-binding GntR family transcriptional regulator
MDTYQIIRSSIIEGDYEPGQRLTEEYLASELNISRTPIREAIKRLEAEGFVTSLKRGISVRTFSKKDIRQIYDLRSLLEGYAASQAACYRVEDDLTELNAIHQLFTKAIHDLGDSNTESIKEIARLNNAFHNTLIRASKNDHIVFLISKVIVLPLVFRSFFWFDREKMLRSLDGHEILIRAIGDRDSDRAKTAMMEHIYKGRDHVLHHFAKHAKTERKRGK